MENIKSYVLESYEELLYKVTWPTWKELQSTSVLVIIASIIFAIVIALMDFVVGSNPGGSIFKGILYYVYRLFGMFA